MEAQAPPACAGFVVLACAKGMKNAGSQDYGGLIATAGGLPFIGATTYDKNCRVFDNISGEALWEATAPFWGNATLRQPIQINGQQFVVIAAVGGKDTRSKSIGACAAFAPAKNPGQPSPRSILCAS